MNKYAIVSQNVPQVCEALEKFGFKLIYTEAVDEFISYEKNHADMQVLKCDDNIYVLSQCKNLINKITRAGFRVIKTTKIAQGEYPNNILLNCKIIGKNIIGKIDYIDPSVIEYCKNNRYSLINVNQGYSACSCIQIAESAIITADYSIFNALSDTEIDVLKISEGHIILSGAQGIEYGFIGGSSVALDNHNLLFFGDITLHPDYIKIKEFCQTRNVKIHYIANIPLIDIGGVILLKN